MHKGEILFPNVVAMTFLFFHTNSVRLAALLPAQVMHQERVHSGAKFCHQNKIWQ